MWSDDYPNSQLIDLKLPSGFHLTGALLKAIAAQHLSLEHLSCSSPCQRIVVDECESPFGDFAKLKSLSVELGYSFQCQCADTESVNSISQAFNNLHIESLNLSGNFHRHLRWEDENIWAQSELLIPGPITTPSLIKTLAHVRLDFYIEVKHAEYLLFHCRHLETVWLKGVLECGEYPPLIRSHHQMSTSLWSVTLGFGMGADKDVWVGWQ